jgi:SAM-dependent methyltransferase
MQPDNVSKWAVVQVLKTGKHFRRIIQISEEKGLYFAVRILVNLLFGYFYFKIFCSSRTFIFQGKPYSYFYHWYNVTWTNERAIEIPIIWDVVTEHSEMRILEVGNVLSHYFSVDHVILDKYEHAEGVINQDVVNFQPMHKYDLIISVSTLEHVGWDENQCEPRKILLAIENLKRCLASGGTMVVTLPLGQNPAMDDLLGKGELRFTEQYFFKRVAEDNRWIEVDWTTVQETECENYLSPNLLLVGFIHSSTLTQGI